MRKASLLLSYRCRCRQIYPACMPHTSCASGIHPVEDASGSGFPVVPHDIEIENRVSHIDVRD